jgi:hypothetical protein
MWRMRIREVVRLFTPLRAHLAWQKQATVKLRKTVSYPATVLLR